MENGQYDDQDWKYIHMMPDMKRLGLPTDCGWRMLLGMQDDSFWLTARMNRINGWRLPAEEGLAIC